MEEVLVSGVEMTLVSSKRGASRFAEVETTELIATFLRFSSDARAGEAGGELVSCIPPFFEDRG